MNMKINRKPVRIKMVIDRLPGFLVVSMVTLLLSLFGGI